MILKPLRVSRRQPPGGRARRGLVVDAQRSGGQASARSSGVILPLGMRVRHMRMVGCVMGRQGRGAGLLIGASGEHWARAGAGYQVRARRGRVCMRNQVRVLRVRGWRVLRTRRRWRRRGWRMSRGTPGGTATVSAVERATVRRAIHQLPYFLLVVGYVVRQFGLLEPGCGHPLVARRPRRRRIGTVQTRLDQGLPRLARYHRLQLPRRERVHVPGLAGNQQHHLRTCQRRQLVGLQSEVNG